MLTIAQIYLIETTWYYS